MWFYLFLLPSFLSTASDQLNVKNWELAGNKIVPSVICPIVDYMSTYSIDCWLDEAAGTSVPVYSTVTQEYEHHLVLCLCSELFPRNRVMRTIKKRMKKKNFFKKVRFAQVVRSAPLSVVQSTVPRV